MIETVLVNHNTAEYAELALRSLHALNAEVPLAVSLLDNASTESAQELFAYARTHGVAVIQTGHSTSTARNTHGENLARFMLERPKAEKFLVMDADVCFLERGTVAALDQALEACPQAWAAQAKMLPFAALLYEGWQPRERPEMYWRQIVQFGRDFTAEEAGEALRRATVSYRGEIQDRPHPFCLLIRNTPILQLVLAKIGMSTAFINADLPWGGWYDTAALTARVLSTHDLDWFVADVPPVLHYAWVSQRKEDPELMNAKLEDCRRRLAEYRTSGRRGGAT